MNIEQDLKDLLAKYQEESANLSEQIISLRAKKTKVDESINQFKKMLGIQGSRQKNCPSTLHRKEQFANLTLASAITFVLSAHDGLPRIEIARAIALPNKESIAIVSQSIHNAERSQPFLNSFDYSDPPIGTIRSKKLFWLKKAAVLQVAPQADKPEPKDIFADLNDFAKRQVEKHYPQRAVKT